MVHYRCIILNILCMQSISSCISCIKFIKYNIVRKIGVKESPLSNPSSLHGIPLPHNSWFEFMVLLPLGMQFPRFVHLTIAAIISTLLLHTQILVTFPCSLLDNLSNAYPHASFWPWVWKPHHFFEWWKNTQLYFGLLKSTKSLLKSSWKLLEKEMCCCQYGQI